MVVLSSLDFGTFLSWLGWPDRILIPFSRFFPLFHGIFLILEMLGN